MNKQVCKKKNRYAITMFILFSRLVLHINFFRLKIFRLTDLEFDKIKSLKLCHLNIKTSAALSGQYQQLESRAPRSSTS